MLSTRLIVLLPFFLTLTSATHPHHRRDAPYEDTTTTSTEIVYVTVTQTRTTSGSPYTVLVTPTPYPDTTTTTSCTTTTTTTSCTTETEEPYPTKDAEPTTSSVVYYPYGNDTVTYPYVPSAGYTSTVKLNMTTYATVAPTGPRPSTVEGAAGRVGVAKGVLLAVMGAAMALM